MIVTGIREGWTSSSFKGICHKIRVSENGRNYPTTKIEDGGLPSPFKTLRFNSKIRVSGSCRERGELEIDGGEGWGRRSKGLREMKRRST